MTKWERVAAKTVHFALYLLLFLMPISGWLLSTAAGHPPNFFWLVEIPMPGIGINKGVVTAAANIHLILAWVICILVAIHIIAAFKHHLINKDNILTRMWPGV